MPFSRQIAFSVGALALVLSLLVGTALAAPPAQGDILPTPTLPKVDNIEYSLTTVGGNADPVIYAHEPTGGFTFTDTVAQTHYPAGMSYTVGVTSEHGDIERVVWELHREEKFFIRIIADYDPATDQWVARVWDEGGQPPGLEGLFFWKATDNAGNTVTTEPQYTVYTDPNNVWYRMENNYLIFYYYGIGDDPNVIAHGMAEFIEGVHQRWIMGFGGSISYKPLAVGFPDEVAWGAKNLSGIATPGILGSTDGGMGLTTLVLRNVEDARNSADPCIAGVNWTEDYVIWDMYTTVAHEVTHMVQFEVMGGQVGLEWLSEGQAEYFTDTYRPYDARLRNLATLQDLPNLHTPIGSSLKQADGCGALSYYVGPSFLNYLVSTYGIDAHRQAMELMNSDNLLFYDAVERVTGVPFLDIENAWRTYLGFEPLTPENLDPSLALQPYEDSLFAVGDKVTLPAVPAMAMLYTEPVPNALIAGSCWANMEVEILAMGQLDGVIYIQVDCMGQKGWMTRDQVVGVE